MVLMSSEGVISQFTGEYRWLSNFWYCNVVMEGWLYKTAEHAYQAYKTLDEEERKYIRYLRTPGEAKRAGKLITLRPDWEEIKIPAMLWVLKDKFSRPGLRELLINTGDRTLIEGNYHGDFYWGVDLRTGRGDNNLGKLIMQVRDNLRHSS